MSSCCSSNSDNVTYAKKHTCPEDKKEYGLVSVTTIKQHIKAPWSWKPKDQGYYFCSDPGCSVVYFAQDNLIIEQSSLRTEVGLKQQSKNALVCYCYGVSKLQAESDATIRPFVVNETKQKNCACETRNPSGKCCLKDFPVSIKPSN